jgi:hypothetical protein
MSSTMRGCPIYAVQPFAKANQQFAKMETLKEQFLTLSVFIDTKDGLRGYTIERLLAEIDAAVEQLNDQAEAAKLKNMRLEALYDDHLNAAQAAAESEEKFELARDHITAEMQKADRNYEKILLKLKLALKVSLYYIKISKEFKKFYTKVSTSNDIILHFTSKILVAQHLSFLFPRDSDADAIDSDHLIVRKFYRVEKTECNINRMFMEYIIKP